MINEPLAGLESAFVKMAFRKWCLDLQRLLFKNWARQLDKKIDDQLIRSYGSIFAIFPGLQAGTYTKAVKPVIPGVEGTQNGYRKSNC